MSVCLVRADLGLGSSCDSQISQPQAGGHQGGRRGQAREPFHVDDYVSFTHSSGRTTSLPEVSCRVRAGRIGASAQTHVGAT